MWSTVHTLHVTGNWKFDTTLDRLVSDPVFRSLRVLDGDCTEERLQELCFGRERGLTSLGF